jgi:HK97 family phage major capsid protein
MQSIQALREQHASLAFQTRELVEKHNGDWTGDHQAKYEASLSDLDKVKAQIDRAEKALELAVDKAVENKASETVERKVRDAGRELFTKYLRGGDKALTAQDWADIRATMSTTTTTEGGHTVPVDVASSISEVLKAYGGVRSVANVISSSMGNDINFPTSDGTSETGELIGQNTTATAADPSFGVVTLKTYKFSSKIVAVPYELLQDSNADIEGFIARRLGERLARIQNTMFTTGNGSTQPNGVVTASAAGKVGSTGQTTTVIVDDLIDLVHAIDPAYRVGPVRFMMNDATLKVIRKLKDTAGRPIFMPGYDGLGGAMGDQVLGYGVTINQDMAVPAANAKSILFGDFSRYTIRDVMGMTLFRFEDSAYAKLGQVGFLAWMRSGGQLTDAGQCIKSYAHSAT